MEIKISDKLLCYHCGDQCNSAEINIGDKTFCCPGCKLVYEVLQENNLCTYYTLNNMPGKKQNAETGKRYSFLDEKKLQDSLITFKNNQTYYTSFHIPSIHCSSCIYLLENLNRINDAVISSRIDFLRKELSIVYDSSRTTLRTIVEQLSHIGYEPSIHLDALEQDNKKIIDRSRIYKIGIAGFCFGNIMLLSFPDYFASGLIEEQGLKYLFNYLNLFLALPVFFYSASEFFGNAWRGLRERTISIDVPIAIGIIAMFIRSSYEVLSGTGTGYFDSMTGLVFFMLIGRKFQSFTFDSLAFDRNYKSYFPIAVARIKNGIENPVSVYDLEVNDKIRIRNNEVIPVDGLLLKGNAVIDYSFVTGESKPVSVNTGESVFAGARQTAGIIELSVAKKIAQSHLTQLWNQRIDQPVKSNFQKMVQAISKWFIVVTLLIAITAGLYWYGSDPVRGINAFTTVLVIACACALALSAPFTFGNILRILGQYKIYLKNNETIERLADIDTIVFDKTGTLTSNNADVQFTGTLSEDEILCVAALFNESAHPLSRRISNYLNLNEECVVQDFKEIPGEGLSAVINGKVIMAGKAAFTGAAKQDVTGTKVYVTINGIYKGCFVSGDAYRPGIEKLVSELLQMKCRLAVLSGDNDSEARKLRQLFGDDAEILFNQLPADKLNYIKSLQQKGKRVLMIGDGLNDAGALMQSDAGLSVSDDINNFSPASNGIIDAGMLHKIPSLLKYSRTAISIIIVSFIISLLYNFIGLAFAVQGILSPVIAAILMPVSTISLVFFTVISSSVAARYYSFKKP